MSKWVKDLNIFDVPIDDVTSMSIASCNDFSGRLSMACINKDRSVVGGCIETTTTRKVMRFQSERMSTKVGI